MGIIVGIILVLPYINCCFTCCKMCCCCLHCLYRAEQGGCGGHCKTCAGNTLDWVEQGPCKEHLDHLEHEALLQRDGLGYNFPHRNSLEELREHRPDRAFTGFDPTWIARCGDHLPVKPGERGDWRSWRHSRWQPWWPWRSTTAGRRDDEESDEPIDKEPEKQSPMTIPPGPEKNGGTGAGE